jgi:hypothetical protein
MEIPGRSNSPVVICLPRLSKESLENAQITFDKFHVMMIVNKGVDAVRRFEQRINGILKKHGISGLKILKILPLGKITD